MLLVCDILLFVVLAYGCLLLVMLWLLFAVFVIVDIVFVVLLGQLPRLGLVRVVGRVGRVSCSGGSLQAGRTARSSTRSHLRSKGSG